MYISRRRCSVHWLVIGSHGCECVDAPKRACLRCARARWVCIRTRIHLLVCRFSAIQLLIRFCLQPTSTRISTCADGAYEKWPPVSREGNTLEGLRVEIAEARRPSCRERRSQTRFRALTCIGGRDEVDCGDVDGLSLSTERCATLRSTLMSSLASGTLFCCWFCCWELLILLISRLLGGDVRRVEEAGAVAVAAVLAAAGVDLGGETGPKRLMPSILAIRSWISIDHSSCMEECRVNAYCIHQYTLC